MMKNAGSDAFPAPYHVNINPESDNSGDIDSSSGLTKREYFAGVAMRGLLAGVGRGGTPKWWIEQATKEAVFIADTLLEALEA